MEFAGPPVNEPLSLALSPQAGQGGRRWVFYALSLTFFALGLMSKPMLVTVPFVLLLLDYWPLRRLQLSTLNSQLSTLFEKLPFFALSAVSCVVTFLTQCASDSVYPLEALSLAQRLANAVVAYAMYLRDTVWPAHLAVFYPLPPTVPVSTVIIAGAVLLGITMVVITVGRRTSNLEPGTLNLELGGRENEHRTSNIQHPTSNVGKRRTSNLEPGTLNLELGGRENEHPTSNIQHPTSNLEQSPSPSPQPSTLNPQPALAVGWLWYLGMLVPVIGLVQVGLQARADRYTYLPLIGVFIMVVWATLGGRASSRALDSSVAADSQGSRGRSLSRLRPLAFSLCLAVLLACGLRTRDQLRHWQNSESLFRQALAVTKDSWLAHYNLAGALAEQGRVEEAIAEGRQAVAIRPAYPKAHLSLGNGLAQQGQVQEAMAEWQKALELDPRLASAHNNLGNALLGMGRVDDALEHLQAAVKNDPELASARNNLGNALMRKGRTAEAIVQLQEAVRLRPDYARARCSLGGALLREGRAAEAVKEFEAALAAQPDNPQVLDTLAWVRATCPDATVRNGAGALELAERANQLTGGGNVSVLATLAAACAEAERFPEAVATVQRALELAAPRGETPQTAALRAQLAGYEKGVPFRDPGLAPRGR